MPPVECVVAYVMAFPVMVSAKRVRPLVGCLDPDPAAILIRNHWRALDMRTLDRTALTVRDATAEATYPCTMRRALPDGLCALYAATGGLAAGGQRSHSGAAVSTNGTLHQERLRVSEKVHGTTQIL